MLTGIDLRICPKCKKANLIRRPLALARIFHEELFGQVFLKDFDCQPGQRQVKVSLRRPLAGSNSWVGCLAE
jgi:hypothetical protein